MQILRRFFPKVMDNRFRGRKLALWLFCPLLLMNLVIAITGIFARDGGAQSADGIPLDRFGGGGAQAVIGVIALLGLAKLLLWLLGVLALFRYRAMIPLMFLLIVIDQLARKGVMQLKPILHVGTSTGSFVNLAILAVSVIGLVLSVQGKGYTATPDPK